MSCLVVDLARWFILFFLLDHFLGFEMGKKDDLIVGDQVLGSVAVAIGDDVPGLFIDSQSCLEHFSTFFGGNLGRTANDAVVYVLEMLHSLGHGLGTNFNNNNKTTTKQLAT